MIVSFEASANIDTRLFGYFTMKYDPEFFQDIRENLTEISKNDMLTFSCDTDSIKLIFGEYSSVKRIIKVSDVEQKRFTDKFNSDFNHRATKKFESVKLNIDRDYFYFSGLYVGVGKQLIEFQSLNFDKRFIDSLETTYKKQECVVA